MSKLKRFLTVFVATIFALLLCAFAVACTEEDKTPVTYTVTWIDFDGTVLERDVGVKKGETPSFDSQNPTRASDGDYDYTFEGWSPELKPVTANVTYTAKYSAEYNKGGNTYTITFAVNGEDYGGVVLNDSVVVVSLDAPSGEFIVTNGTTITIGAKTVKAVARSNGKFSDWKIDFGSGAITLKNGTETLSGNITITATFDKKSNIDNMNIGEWDDLRN